LITKDRFLLQQLEMEKLLLGMLAQQMLEQLEHQNLHQVLQPQLTQLHQD